MRRTSRRLQLAAVAITLVTAALAAAVAAASGRAERPEPRVVVVLDPGGCPDPTTLRLCEGISRAMRLTGVRARVVAPTFREDIADFIALAAGQHYDAVVMFGTPFDPAVASVVRRFPNVPFVLLDAPRPKIAGVPPNLAGVVLEPREAAFLAGWLAARLETDRAGPDVVGIVGGFRYPGVTTFVRGFAAGAKRAAPGVKVLVDYSNDFVDATRCAALARRQIARGAGTVFNVAGACGLGTMQAAREAGIWAVGVDSDQSFLGPHVLTSVLKSFEAGFVEVFRQVKAGKVRTGRDTILTMRDGAAGLGRISPRVPASLVAEVERLRARIVSGRLRTESSSMRSTGG